MATKKTTARTKNKTLTHMWQMSFQAAITGLSSMAALDNSSPMNEADQAEMAAEVVKRAEKIADIAMQRLG